MCNNKIAALLYYGCFLIAMMGVVLFYQKTDKIKKMGFIFWPAIDALKNNFSANPALILSKLSAKLPASNKQERYVINTGVGFADQQSARQGVMPSLATTG
jgi:hypothetical protein